MAPSAETPNFLTFDVEEWYHTNYAEIDPARFENGASELQRPVERILDLCDQARIRCTFFVVGSVAEKQPGTIRNIAARGHEIASHSYAHKAVHSMTPREFGADLQRSCAVLESVSGHKVLGYRAPSFSVTRRILPWFYGALEQQGLEYSSSVFPGKTFLYGIPDFPRRMHRPSAGGRQTRILELPVTRVDVAGMTIGLYVRLFPAALLRWRILAENKQGRPAMLYVHPRELDPLQSRLPLRWPKSVIHYYGVRGCESKLRRLLRSTPVRFMPIAEAIDSLNAEPAP